MEEQLEVSDVLVVNKLDLISVEDRDALKNQLNEVNKYSSKIYTTYGQVNIEELSQFRDQLVMTHTHSHHHGINSMQYTFTTAIDRQLFYPIYFAYVNRLNSMFCNSHKSRRV